MEDSDVVFEMILKASLEAASDRAETGEFTEVDMFLDNVKDWLDEQEIPINAYPKVRNNQLLPTLIIP